MKHSPAYFPQEEMRKFKPQPGKMRQIPINQSRTSSLWKLFSHILLFCMQETHRPALVSAVLPEGEVSQWDKMDESKTEVRSIKIFCKTERWIWPGRGIQQSLEHFPGDEVHLNDSANVVMLTGGVLGGPQENMGEPSLLFINFYVITCCGQKMIGRMWRT